MWINLSKRPLTSRERKLILIFIICFLFCCLYFILNHKIIKLNDLREQLQAITNESSVYKQLYENPIDYEELLAIYSDIIKKALMNKDLSEFLTDVEKWANEKDITIISINPQSMITEDVTEVTINTIPFEITINGGYDSLLDFISELENYSRISRIYGIELNAPTDDLTFKSSLLWELVVRVNLYYLPT